MLPCLVMLLAHKGICVLVIGRQKAQTLGEWERMNKGAGLLLPVCLG